MNCSTQTLILRSLSNVDSYIIYDTYIDSRLPRAGCAASLTLHTHTYRHISYLGFGEPSLLCHFITLLLIHGLLL